ncbi:hypothetical protein POM88_014682 [Heracleum sosnowskyi]|uniref:Uncharacterized protein n=1 Tax=Heracleum sosnowskyi TaxID=360622 RepID=A0AAD8IK58_9APIA|nr:hypothetical protein POM88_014682 [Heracleum sosnowskyi]
MTKLFKLCSGHQPILTPFSPCNLVNYFGKMAELMSSTLPKYKKHLMQYSGCFRKLNKDAKCAIGSIFWCYIKTDARWSNQYRGNQYRRTKIPLNTVRLFEYAEVVLKDEADIDPDDQNSFLEHLDKVVVLLIFNSICYSCPLTQMETVFCQTILSPVRSLSDASVSCDELIIRTAIRVVLHA